MGKNSNKLRSPIKDKKITDVINKNKGKSKTKITTGLIENILRDCWSSAMSQTVVAKKYNISTVTVHRYCKKNAHKKDLYEPFKADVVLKRADKTEMERLKLINDDSITVIEKTLTLVKLRLDDELQAKEKNITIPHPINMKDLAVILQEITPYILEKKTKPGAPGDKGKATPKGQVFDMFKKQQTK